MPSSNRRLATRILALATALLVPAALVRAEAPGDPSGHWEGAIHAPLEDLAVSVDLAFDDGGKLVGTFSNPGQHIAGFPFWNATVDGRSVKLDVKLSDAEVQAFDGNLGADGKSMTGEFLIGVYAVPFSLTRTGDAKIAAAPTSPVLEAALAGEWTASLDVGGKALPVLLTMTNRDDRTATGSWSSGGGTATPITIAHQGKSIELVSAVTRAAYSGMVSADGTEIVGTLTDGPHSQALTFRRVAGTP
jgi:hypothetical protein